MAENQDETRPYTAEEQSAIRRSTRHDLVRLLERTLEVQEQNQARLEKLVEDSVAAKEIAEQSDRIVSISTTFQAFIDRLGGYPRAIGEGVRGVRRTPRCDGHLSAGAAHRARFCANPAPRVRATRMRDVPCRP